MGVRPYIPCSFFISIACSSHDEEEDVTKQKKIDMMLLGGRTPTTQHVLLLVMVLLYIVAMVLKCCCVRDDNIACFDEDFGVGFLRKKMAGINVHTFMPTSTVHRYCTIKHTL